MTEVHERSPAFSVVVIARNEAHTLPRLLGGLREFLARGGDVVVADTGSTDDTAAVAEAHGARVERLGDRFASRLGESDAALIEARFARAGEGPLVEAGQRLFHFGRAREHAGWLARRDHVLQLDASDELLALDVDFVDRQARAPASLRLEYRLDAGELSLWITRFYDRRRAVWRGRVHEALYPRGGVDGHGTPVSTVRARDEQLRVRHHWDVAKPRTYVAGLALAVIEEPHEARWLRYLGRALHLRGWHRSAIPLLESHAARGDAWVGERAVSLCTAGAAREALGEVDHAEDCYRRATALDGSRREPVLRLAALRMRAGDLEAAVRHARAALAIPRTSPLAEADVNYGHLPHALLYWALFWLGRRDEARRHWESCRRLAPDHPDVLAHARLFRA